MINLKYPHYAEYGKYKERAKYVILQDDNKIK